MTALEDALVELESVKTERGVLYEQLAVAARQLERYIEAAREIQEVRTQFFRVLSWAASPEVQRSDGPDTFVEGMITAQRRVQELLAGAKPPAPHRRGWWLNTNALGRCLERESGGVQCELVEGHAGPHACPQAMADRYAGGRFERPPGPARIDDVSAYPGYERGRVLTPEEHAGIGAGGGDENDEEGSDDEGE